jgi:hypothetical protein
MDTSLLKRLNKSKVRTALRAQEMGSKNSVSHATGLSVATCGTLLKELLEVGEVLEVEHAKSTGGRRSRQFKFNGNYAYIVSLYPRKEAGIYSIYYQVSNLYGEEIEKNLLMMDYININEFNVLIESLLDKYDYIRVVSLGIPGVVREGRVGICDIESLAYLDLKQLLEDRFKIKVVIENDVNTSAIGYYNKMDFEDESFVYLYYPLDGCPGSGIVIKGDVLRGFSNFSGEVSFLPGEGRNLKGANDDVFLNSVTETIRTLTCVLNPKHVVLSGFGFTKTDLEIVSLKLANTLDAVHVPDIIFEEDFHDSYLYGLISIGLNQYNELL